MSEPLEPNDSLESTTLDGLPTELELRKMVASVRAKGQCGSLQTSNGLPCRRMCRIGTTVCRKHGERSPGTIAKAERLLAVARMPAIQWILDALDQATEDVCKSCGYPRNDIDERKRLDSLSFKLLDRTGFGPRQTIDLNAKRSENEVDVTSYNTEELKELDELFLQLENLEARVRARIAHQVVDGLESAIPVGSSSTIK